MHIRLKKTDKITPELPSVYLIRKNSNLGVCGFSEKETGYIKNRIEKGKDFIYIHRSGSYTCLVINDETKPFFSQLELLRNFSQKIQSVVSEHDQEELMIADLVDDPELLFALIEGILLNNYRFSKYQKATDKKDSFPDIISIFCPHFQEEDMARLVALCEAVYLARDLVNEPLSYLNAERLSGEIRKMGDNSGFSVEVLNKKRLESLQMEGLLAVNRGSIDPPTFSILEWKPELVKNEKPFVLIGKGIVFDTGGLSLKPTANSMDYMKSDMAGAAAVAATIYAIARCGLPVHVIGLIPATDNRPGGNAIVPGDVITMYDGTSVEILNTDAEGRLILADALSWSKQYDPSLVIDLATLTGSAAAAVGSHGTVAMQKQAEEWYEALEESGFYAHERLVLFPLWEEYHEMLKSDIADLKNIGGKEAGAITAGKFLEHFTSFPWIHLDIAGPAFLHSENSYRKKGGSAVGVRLLFDFFYRYAGQDKIGHSNATGSKGI
jgi:leucyl aminopeptidase